MRLVLHFKENDKGWPLWTVDAPVVEAGDNLRIQNYAVVQYVNFVTACRMQREATKEAIEGGAKVCFKSLGEVLAKAFGGAAETN